MSAGIFQFGPGGRNVNVDASGALLVVDGGDPSSYLIFGFGPEGRPLTVTPSGELHVNLSAPVSQNDALAASGNQDLASVKSFDFILDKDVVFTSFDSPRDGSKYVFILEQGTTGGWTITWPTNVLWRGGSPPVLSTASGQIDVVTMIYRPRDGTFLADVGNDFA